MNDDYKDYIIPAEEDVGPLGDTASHGVKRKRNGSVCVNSDLVVNLTNKDFKVFTDSGCAKFLSETKVSSVVRSEVDILIIKATTSVSASLQILVENKLHSAPVYCDETNAYIGFIDLLDIVAWVISTFSASKVLEDLFQTLKDEQKWFTTPVKSIMDRSRRNPFMPVSKDAPLLDAVKIMGNGVHRVPIVDTSNNTFLGVVTHSQIIRLLSESMSVLGDVANQTLEELGLAPHVVVVAQQKESALEAFKLMHQWKVNGLPVVSEKNVLVGNLSASDLKITVRDKFTFSALDLSAEDYIQRIRKEYPTNISPVIFCFKTDTLATVMRILATNHLHRIYVVDNNMELVSVVTLCDILQKIPEVLDSGAETPQV